MGAVLGAIPWLNLEGEGRDREQRYQHNLFDEIWGILRPLVSFVNGGVIDSSTTPLSSSGAIKSLFSRIVGFLRGLILTGPFTG